MIKDDRDGTPVMVDVGGGFGHQVQLLKNTFPDVPGRLIVKTCRKCKVRVYLASSSWPMISARRSQSMARSPLMIATINGAANLTPGARVYSLRFILHDYDFDRVVKILTHLKDAMTPGYSRLLINDWIVPEEGPSRFMTAEDMNMMSLSGMEHTEQQHRAMVEAAGLRITNVFRAGDGISEDVIEAEVA